MHGSLYSLFTTLFKYLQIKWTYPHSKWLYLLILFIPGFYLMEEVEPSLREFTPILNLSLFAVLVVYAIFILVTSYLRTKLAKIRLIALAFIVPFLPFLLFLIHDLPR